MSFRDTKTPGKPTGKAKWQIPMRLNAKNGKMEYYLEGELKDKFIKLFPKNSNRRLMRWFGISHSTCERFKRELGLKKDMTAIRKQLAKDVKKICEKNGYYDSLRGRAPSEAAIEATRKRFAEGFHPWAHLKKTNPRKFKRGVMKRTEKRNKSIRKDRLRVKYGLEQKTKMHLPFAPLSHRASSQKHVMIKQNDYFADPDHPDWVCYDAQTRRSERREATARRHGLIVVEGE